MCCRFGGGPAVNHLYQCDTCQVEMDRLKRRQKVEMETFVQVSHSQFITNSSFESVSVLSKIDSGHKMDTIWERANGHIFVFGANGSQHIIMFKGQARL